jgi:hypothetical protein
MSATTIQFFKNFKIMPTLCRYNLNLIKKPENLYLEKNPKTVTIEKNNIINICKFIHYNSISKLNEFNQLQADLYIKDKEKSIEIYEYCDFIMNTNKLLYTYNYLINIYYFSNKYI